jgi:hypothetical protein
MKPKKERKYLEVDLEDVIFHLKEGVDWKVVEYYLFSHIFVFQ